MAEIRGLSSTVQSGWRPVTSCLPQGSVLSLVLFSIIKNLHKGIRVSKFADDTKLGRVADTPQGCTTIQQNLDRWRAGQGGT